MNKIQNNKVAQDPFEETNVVALLLIAGFFLLGSVALYFAFLG